MKTEGITGSEEAVRMRRSVCDAFMSMCLCIYDLYLDIESIKSLGTNSLQQESDPPSLVSLPASGERIEPTPAFILLFVFSRKMAKAGISLRSLNETLNRVETKLQTLEAQFTDLDSSLQKLAQKFELQAEMLEKEMSQNTPWTQAPEEVSTGRDGSVVILHAQVMLLSPILTLGSEEEREPGRRERPVSERRGGAAGGQRQGGGHCGRPRPCLPPGLRTAAPPPRSCSSVGADSVL
ncbi:uncharacterized protein LOC129210034 [Grus americana]|uniref:uncharacterized protein LOC129210034 n=1 Tax=Grus americana TaxID=9117 RepID=UPI0024084D12|nr:uncharacterized protein LOC129210034 [Grus americana]